MPSAGTLLDKTKTRGTDRSVGTAFSPSSQAGPTQDELAAICAVVVRPGAKLVRVTSTNDGVPTGMAVADAIARPDYPWAAPVAQGIVALDFDDARRSPRLAERLAAQLRDVGLEAVVLASGRVGHRHLFVQCSTDTELDAVNHLYAELKADGEHVGWQGSMRPPGVCHRKGMAPQLLSHKSWGEVAAVLTHRAITPPPVTHRQGLVVDAGLAHRLAAAPCPEFDTLPLSPELAAFCLTGARPSKYRTNSEAIAGVMCSWQLRTGATDADRDGCISWLLHQPAMAHRLSEYSHTEPGRYRTRQARRLREAKWLVHQWDAEAEWLEEQGRVPKADRRPVQMPLGLDEMLHRSACAAGWLFRTEGQSGASAALVLLDLLRRCQWVGSARIEVSIRNVIKTLLGAVGCKNTVRRALAQLEADGLIRRLRAGKGQQGSIIEVLDPEALGGFLEKRGLHPCISIPPQAGEPLEENPAVLEGYSPLHLDEGWATGSIPPDLLAALSLREVEVLHFLTAEAVPQSTDEVAAATGVLPRSLVRSSAQHLGPLKKLAFVGLVEALPGGLWGVVSLPDFVAVQAALAALKPCRQDGAAGGSWEGWNERTAARIEYERELYLNWLAETAATRAGLAQVHIAHWAVANKQKMRSKWALRHYVNLAAQYPLPTTQAPAVPPQLELAMV